MSLEYAFAKGIHHFALRMLLAGTSKEVSWWSSLGCSRFCTAMPSPLSCYPQRPLSALQCAADRQSAQRLLSRTETNLHQPPGEAMCAAPRLAPSLPLHPIVGHSAFRMDFVRHTTKRRSIAASFPSTSILGRPSTPCSQFIGELFLQKRQILYFF